MARVKVILGGDPIIKEEHVATEAMTPGHLLARASTTTISKNAVASADIALLFAMEREEMGKGITDAYAIGDVVKVAVCYPGCRVYAFIPSGQNISACGYLEADATGCLKAYSAGKRLAQALEAVDNSAGPGDARIRVELI